MAGYRKIKLSGIYCISNKITGKVYIGYSIDCIGRWSSHYHLMFIGGHSSPKLSEDLTKFGIESFEFNILEAVSKTKFKAESGLSGKEFESAFRKLLLKKEKMWMSKFDIKNCYNKDDKYFN